VRVAFALQRERCQAGPNEMQVGLRIPVGIQLYKADAGSTSGPTWHSSHFHDVFVPFVVGVASEAECVLAPAEHEVNEAPRRVDVVAARVAERATRLSPLHSWCTEVQARARIRNRTHPRVGHHGRTHHHRGWHPPAAGDHHGGFDSTHLNRSLASVCTAWDMSPSGGIQQSVPAPPEWVVRRERECEIDRDSPKSAICAGHRVKPPSHGAPIVPSYVPASNALSPFARDQGSQIERSLLCRGAPSARRGGRSRGQSRT
jgi:hypothetical protein